ncbi:heavy-metal-associated domain-containing protein [Candidatus Pacebacteria bacterium]|nr:heavy-metal-associated domain-containing protein [Candidatus Paceibacterota bacterium]
MVKVEMNIEGMHCGGCATGIQMVTDQMNGVSSSFVDLDEKKGTFEFDETVTNSEALIGEIAKLGYQASIIA